MGYKIEDCTGTPEEIRESARFLADFVADGEAPGSDETETSADVWESRLHSWWSNNPYCRQDSPRGFILRRKDNSIGGFFGFIPHDYVSRGEVVPSLISTTTYVRSDCRDASVGLFFRAHRLRSEYQLIDGGPNEKLEPLLERAGYQHAEETKLHFVPVRRRSWRPVSWALQIARPLAFRANQNLGEGKLVTDVDEIAEVPVSEGPELRKHVDRETLRWYLASGSRKKYLVAWCDGDGRLLGYLIGVRRRKFGLSTFFVLDAASFVEGERANFLNGLVSKAASNPGSAGIPSAADVIIWPTDKRRTEGRRNPLSFLYDSKLYFRLPPKWEGVRRRCFPFEGDKILL